MTQTIRISSLEAVASFAAYCARPDEEPRGGIVVIQEIFGVNAGIRRKCDKLASAGYLTVAPDLFWRLQLAIELDPDVESEMRQALEMMGRFDQEKAVSDIEATIRHVRQALGVSKVGAVGFCLGGRLAYMTAARTDVDATVGYYPVSLPELLREKHAIAHPLMLHIAGADTFVPPEEQQAVHAGLDDHPKVTLHDYPGLDHGFATESGRRRNDDGAQLADSRADAFFAEHIG